MERKTLTGQLEIKSFDEGGIFEGYASVYGIQDYDGDVIVKGAFKKSIDEYNTKSKMPKMLWQHNTSMIIGQWLEMREDENGLYVKGKLILEVEKGRKAYALMKAGQLDAMSVGFNIRSAEPVGTSSIGKVIDSADLWEISLVTWGANPEALISSVKSIDTIRDFESFLRDAGGFSRNEAKRLAAHGFVVKEDQREAESQIIDSLKKLSFLFGDSANG